MKNNTINAQANNCRLAFELLQRADVLTADCLQLYTIECPSSEIKGFQGGCSDGERYYYQALMHYDHASGQEDNYTRIAKLDLTTGEVVQWSGDLRLNHANDITYNPKTNLLIVSNNSPHPKRLTLIDADTLEIVRCVELPFGAYSIEYNAKRDAYVAGISGTWDFTVLNADFEPMDGRVFKGTPLTARYTKQGVGADDYLIYFILWDGKHSKEPDFQNVISVYDWEGNFKGLIEFDVGVKEPENLSIVNGDIIAVCGASVPIVYKIVPRLK